MAKKVKKQKRTGGEKSASLAGNAAQILKGCIGGIIFTIAAVLIFAYLLKSMSLSDGVIAPVNEGIKMIAVLLTAYLATKKAGGPALADRRIERRSVYGTWFLCLFTAGWWYGHVADFAFGSPHWFIGRAHWGHNFSNAAEQAETH